MVRAGRVLLALFGVVVMAYGAWGLFLSPHVPHHANLPVWLAASVLAHDIALAPVVFGLCWAGTRLLPARARPWAAGALLSGGAVLVVGLPAVVRRGRDSNPTVLPLDYGRNILLVLLVVTTAAIAAPVTAAALRATRSLLARHGVSAKEAASLEGGAAREGNADHGTIHGRRQQGGDRHDRQP